MTAQRIMKVSQWFRRRGKRNIVFYLKDKNWKKILDLDYPMYRAQMISYGKKPQSEKEYKKLCELFFKERSFAIFGITFRKARTPQNETFPSIMMRFQDSMDELRKKRHEQYHNIIYGWRVNL